MSPHDKGAASRSHRIRIAKKMGQALVRRMSARADLSPDQLLVLADEFEALFTTYPDVYPNPPVSVERLRAHAQELREADALARQAEAEGAEATRKLEAARLAYGAALNEIGAPGAKPEKPS